MIFFSDNRYKENQEMKRQSYRRRNKQLANNHLRSVQSKPRDEYYTRMEDIERIIPIYKQYIKGKTVYLNCDNPKDSNFWKYFIDKFEEYEIKELRATYKETDENKKSTYHIATSPTDIKTEELKGDGDFLSSECINILKTTDIVITNPPFSLFNKLVEEIDNNNKKYILLGPFMKSASYFLLNRNIFYDSVNAITSFNTPEGETSDVPRCYFYNNLGLNKRRPIDLNNKKYDEQEYRKYYNYDAIEVSRVKDIPIDYDGLIGVTSTFLERDLPEYEFIGILQDLNFVERNIGDISPHIIHYKVIDGKLVEVPYNPITHDLFIPIKKEEIKYKEGAHYYKDSRNSQWLKYPFNRVFIKKRQSGGSK